MIKPNKTSAISIPICISLPLASQNGRRVNCACIELRSRTIAVLFSLERQAPHTALRPVIPLFHCLPGARCCSKSSSDEKFRPLNRISLTVQSGPPFNGSIAQDPSMFEVITAFLIVLSVGILVAHALDAFRHWPKPKG
jgi:hypothetical protein